MAEGDTERLDSEKQRALDALGGTTPHMRPRPLRTRLERWAVALRVMAWIWWLGGLVTIVIGTAGAIEQETPAATVAAAALQGLFLTALGGMLLYAFSYILVGVDCIVENTALTAEAMLAREPADEDTPTERGEEASNG